MTKSIHGKANSCLRQFIMATQSTRRCLCRNINTVLYSVLLITNYYRGDIMDKNNEKDPYHFEETKDGLEKRFRVVISARDAYKLREKRRRSNRD